MRSFFELTNDPSQSDLQHVADFDLAGFDYLLFQEDQPLGPLPRAAYLCISRGEPADLLATNPLGWLIVSKRCYKLMKPLLVQSPHETLNLRMVSDETREAIRGYELLHPMLSIHALVNGSKDIYSHPKVIDVGSIPAGVHLF